MKYRRFFIFIVELFAVCSAVLFIPVITVRAVYPTQSASFHANLFNGLSLKSVTDGDISFFCYGDQSPVILLILLVCVGTILLSFKKSLWAGILFYIVALILLADGNNIEITVIVSPALQNQGHTEYQGFSPFALFDLLIFTAIPVLQFLLLKKKYILNTDTDFATNTEKNLLQKSNEP